MKVMLLESFNDCLTNLDTFTETPTAPDQAVAAVNLGEQRPSSIHHIVGDAVSTGRENGKKSTGSVTEGCVVSYSLCYYIFYLRCYAETINPIPNLSLNLTYVLPKDQGNTN